MLLKNGRRKTLCLWAYLQDLSLIVSTEGHFNFFFFFLQKKYIIQIEQNTYNAKDKLASQEKSL